MTVTLPETLQYGKVVGRFVLAVADVPEDPDSLPNAVPAVGTISFTSMNPLTKETTATPPTTVVRSVIPAAIDNNGYLYNPKDPTGPRGIWLVAGPYKVSYALNTGAIAGHDILVLPEHDDETPLDLISALPPGGPVLTASQYAELTARMDTLEAGSGPGGGTTDHNALSNREIADQHPMSAITGLVSALDGKAEDDDARLSDARTPTVHAASHASGGSDPVTPASIGAATPSQVSSGDSTTLAAAQSHAQGLVDALTSSLGSAAAANTGDFATATQGAKADAAIPSGLVDAKGDLIVATADDTVTRLPASTDGHVLTLDSAESAGMKWAAPSGGGDGGNVGPVLWFRKTNTSIGTTVMPGVTSWTNTNALYHRFGIIPIPQAVNIDQISFRINDTGSGREGKLVLYAWDGLAPASQVFYSGPLPLDTAGVKTVSASLSLQSGYYLAGLYVNSVMSLESHTLGVVTSCNEYGTLRAIEHNTAYPSGDPWDIHGSGVWLAATFAPSVKLRVA